jgi:hypothetical protein
MVPYVPLEITVGNEVPRENIPGGTEIRAIIFVPLKINVRKKASSENILPRTLILTVISKGTLCKDIF